MHVRKEGNNRMWLRHNTHIINRIVACCHGKGVQITYFLRVGIDKILSLGFRSYMYYTSYVRHML